MRPCLFLWDWVQTCTICGAQTELSAEIPEFLARLFTLSAFLPPVLLVFKMSYRLHLLSG